MLQVIWIFHLKSEIPGKKERIIFVDCIYDGKAADKTEYLLQAWDSSIFLFQVESQKNITGIGSTCMNLESYEHYIKLRQLQSRNPKW